MFILYCTSILLENRHHFPLLLAFGNEAIPTTTIHIICRTQQNGQTLRSCDSLPFRDSDWLIMLVRELSCNFFTKNNDVGNQAFVTLSFYPAMITNILHYISFSFFILTYSLGFYHFRLY